MKILNVMLGRGRGGLERAVLDAHEGLLKAGCTVTSVFAPDAWVRTQWPAGLDFQLLRSFGAWDPLARLGLWRLTKSQGPDLVLCHGNRAVQTARLARRMAPVMAICHTTNYSILKHLDDVDGIIALTSRYQERLVGAGYRPERIRLVPNAIRIGPSPPEPFNGGPLLIGGLGRMVPDKGFDLLAEACAILAGQGLKFRCVIGGVDQNGGTEGLVALRDRYGLKPEQFRALGWVEDTPAFIRSLDIFCMPSRREVLSIALLEALEAGRPIVCSRVPGLESVFQDGVEGLFVDLNNAGQLAQAIARIADDAALGRRMGAAARRRAHAYDLQVVGPLLETALAGLLAEFRRPVER